MRPDLSPAAPSDSALARPDSVPDPAPSLLVAWRLLVYRIPSEPSRLRATVWRRLKASGAIYLQSSIAALPQTPANDRALHTLQNQIVQEMSGSALLFSAEAIVGNEELTSIFNAARDDEYAEIVDKCGDFLREVEKEVAINHLTFAELEENEEDLAKLVRWFEKVRDRDVLGAEGSRAASEALATCSHTLDQFAERVYRFESDQRRR